MERFATIVVWWLNLQPVQSAPSAPSVPSTPSVPSVPFSPLQTNRRSSTVPGSTGRFHHRPRQFQRSSAVWAICTAWLHGRNDEGSQPVLAVNTVRPVLPICTIGAALTVRTVRPVLPVCAVDTVLPVVARLSFCARQVNGSPDVVLADLESRTSATKKIWLLSVCRRSATLRHLERDGNLSRPFRFLLPRPLRLGGLFHSSAKSARNSESGATTSMMTRDELRFPMRFLLKLQRANRALFRQWGWRARVWQLPLLVREREVAWPFLDGGNVGYWWLLLTSPLVDLRLPTLFEQLFVSPHIP